MGDNIKEKDVFVGLFDILGFRKLVTNNELSRVAETYRRAKNYFDEGIEAINRLQKHQDKKDRVKYRGFSDTFLIYTTGTNDNCFLSMLAACDFLFMASVECSLPIRGAVTLGPLMSSAGIELGKSIVEAYEKEQKQDWIGCWIADECRRDVNIDRYMANKSIIPYEIPLKNGKVDTKLAFNWIMSVTWKVMFANGKNDFTLQQVKNAVNFTQGEPHDWDIRRKFDNTNKFIDFVLSPEFLPFYKSGDI